MSEAEWLEGNDPKRMMALLFDRVSERKLRLLAAAFARLFWHLLVDERSRTAVILAERNADGHTTPVDLDEARRQAWTVVPLAELDDLQTSAARAAARTAEADAYQAADLTINEVTSLGSEAAEAAEAAVPTSGEQAYWKGKSAVEKRMAAIVRDVVGNPFQRSSPSGLAPSPEVVRLARGMYDRGDVDRLPEIVAALRDSGYHDERLVGHLTAAGPHVLGCWAIDLLLGRA